MFWNLFLVPLWVSKQKIVFWTYFNHRIVFCAQIQPKFDPFISFQVPVSSSVEGSTVIDEIEINNMRTEVNIVCSLYDNFCKGEPAMFSVDVQTLNASILIVTCQTSLCIVNLLSWWYLFLINENWTIQRYCKLIVTPNAVTLTVRGIIIFKYSHILYTFRTNGKAKIYFCSLILCLKHDRFSAWCKQWSRICY